MEYEYKTLFELDPEVRLNQLAKDGWEPISSSACPPYDDRYHIYVLLRREVKESKCQN